MTSPAPSSDALRDTIFISKATPGDDAFVLWIAPRLEAAGYKVFADIFDLDAGDEWRGKLTGALQTRAVKMLLCCSDETLARRGVKEEIAIAEDLTKQLGDANFKIRFREERRFDSDRPHHRVIRKLAELQVKFAEAGM